MPTKGFKSELYLPHICTDFSNHTRYTVRMSFVEFWPLLHLCWLGAAGSSHIMLQQASQTIPRPGRPGIRVSIVTNADRFLHFSGNSLLTVGIYRKMMQNAQIARMVDYSKWDKLQISDEEDAKPSPSRPPAPVPWEDLGSAVLQFCWKCWMIFQNLWSQSQ